MDRKSFFKSIFPSFTFSNNTDIPKKFGKSYWYQLPGFNNGNQNFLKDFQEIPELNAIINIRARARASWRLKIVDKKTKKEVNQGQDQIKLLKSPNWFQGGGEFWKQSSLFHDIYGNEYLYLLTPLGMSRNYKGLFTLDPSRVVIIYKPTDGSAELFFLDPTGEALMYKYRLTVGSNYDLQRENIIHLNDNRVDPKEILKGTSKLKALKDPLNNIRAAYRKRGIVLNMPIGILTNGISDALGQAVPMDDDEKKDVQYDLRAHGPVPIITNLAVKYNTMEINARRLGLFEEVTEDTGRICDSYGVPFKLLSQLKGNTLNSSGSELRESIKQMYEETTIPESNELIDALNMFFGNDSKSWELQASFAHLPIFAEDVKTRAETINIMITALNTAFQSEAISIQTYKNELAKLGLES